MAAGMVTYLPLIPQASAATRGSPYEDEKYRLTDPFTITANGNAIREKLQQLQRKGTINVRGLPGYYKSTYASRKKAHTGQIRRFALGNEVEEKDESGSNEDCPPSCFTIGVTSSDRDGFKDYIHQQRQLVLMQYTLGEREKSIATLEQTAHKKQQQLIDGEKHLVESKLAVESLMKESQRRRTEAVLRAEEKTKDKVQAMAEVDQAAEELRRIKSAIEKQQQELNECLAAKEIFDQLAPDEWKEKKKKERLVAANADQNKPRKETFISYSLPSVTRKDQPFHNSNAHKVNKEMSIPISPASAAPQSVITWMEQRKEADAEEEPTEINFDDSPLDLELYFKEPQEVLDVFFSLEEQIFSLLQYCHEAEEDTERVDQDFAAVQESMIFKIQCLKKQVQHYDDAIVKANKAIADVQFIVRMFSWGATTGETEDQVLEQLNAGLNKLYQICFGDAKIRGDALQKLASIENEVYGMLDRMDTIATEKVKDILKKKQKESRAKLHEETRHRAKRIDESRQRSLLEAAQKVTHVWFGRKLMSRSQPAEDREKGKLMLRKEAQDNEEYFFT